MAKISRETMLSELLSEYPKAARELLKLGIHCIGCHMSAYETLEQGLKVHGMSDSEIDAFIKKLNDRVEKKIELIDITDEAVDALKKLMKEDNKEDHYLFLSVSENNGKKSFDLELVKEKKDGVKELSIKGLKVLIDNNSLEFIKGKEIDVDNYGFIIE